MDPSFTTTQADPPPQHLVVGVQLSAPSKRKELIRQAEHDLPGAPCARTAAQQNGGHQLLSINLEDCTVVVNPAERTGKARNTSSFIRGDVLVQDQHLALPDDGAGGDRAYHLHTDNNSVSSLEGSNSGLSDYAPSLEFAVDAIFDTTSAKVSPADDDDTDGRSKSGKDVSTYFATALAKDAIQGVNACLFAYGAARTGKSSAIFGTEAEDGVYAKLLEQLLSAFIDRPEDHTETVSPVVEDDAGTPGDGEYKTQNTVPKSTTSNTTTLGVSIFEIFHDRARDLLDAAGSKTVQLKEHPVYGMLLPNLHRQTVATVEDAKFCLDFALKKRALQQGVVFSETRGTVCAMVEIITVVGGSGCSAPTATTACSHTQNHLTTTPAQNHRESSNACASSTTSATWSEATQMLLTPNSDATVNLDQPLKPTRLSYNNNNLDLRSSSSRKHSSSHSVVNKNAGSSLTASTLSARGGSKTGSSVTGTAGDHVVMNSSFVARRATAGTNASGRSCNEIQVGAGSCFVPEVGTSTPREVEQGGASSSHTLFHQPQLDRKRSVVLLVDLPGCSKVPGTSPMNSDRDHYLNLSDNTTKASSTTNPSLANLTHCINLLASEPSECIPWTASQLTILLKETLTSNCRTYMLACVANSNCDVENTVATLKLAQNVRSLQTTARVNAYSHLEVVHRLTAEKKELERSAESEEKTDLLREEIEFRESLLQFFQKEWRSCLSAQYRARMVSALGRLGILSTTSSSGSSSATGTSTGADQLILDGHTKPNHEGTSARKNAKIITLVNESDDRLLRGRLQYQFVCDEAGVSENAEDHEMVHQAAPCRRLVVGSPPGAVVSRPQQSPNEMASNTSKSGSVQELAGSEHQQNGAKMNYAPIVLAGLGVPEAEVCSFSVVAKEEATNTGLGGVDEEEISTTKNELVLEVHAPNPFSSLELGSSSSRGADGVSVLTPTCSQPAATPSSLTTCSAVSVWGRTLKFGESCVCKHGDLILIGRAFLFRVVVSSRSTVDPGTSSTSDVVHEGNNSDTSISQLSTKMSSLLSSADSDSYSELKLYIEDVHEKMGEEAGTAFLATLQEACHCVDEANLISREVRPKDGLKLEVEFIWDIYRENHEEVLVIRVMQVVLADSYVLEAGQHLQNQQQQLLHYWTYSRFRQRLEAMRNVYAQRTEFTKGDILTDPWCEPVQFGDLANKVSSAVPVAEFELKKREVLLKQLEQSLSQKDVEINRRVAEEHYQGGSTFDVLDVGNTGREVRSATGLSSSSCAAVLQVEDGTTPVVLRGARTTSGGGSFSVEYHQGTDRTTARLDQSFASTAISASSTTARAGGGLQSGRSSRTGSTGLRVPTARGHQHQQLHGKLTSRGSRTAGGLLSARTAHGSGLPPHQPTVIFKAQTATDQPSSAASTAAVRAQILQLNQKANKAEEQVEKLKTELQEVTESKDSEILFLQDQLRDKLEEITTLQNFLEISNRENRMREDHLHDLKEKVRDKEKLIEQYEEKASRGILGLRTTSSSTATAASSVNANVPAHNATAGAGFIASGGGMQASTSTAAGSAVVHHVAQQPVSVPQYTSAAHHPQQSVMAQHQQSSAHVHHVVPPQPHFVQTNVAATTAGIIAAKSSYSTAGLVPPQANANANSSYRIGASSPRKSTNEKSYTSVNRSSAHSTSQNPAVHSIEKRQRPTIAASRKQESGTSPHKLRAQSPRPAEKQKSIRAQSPRPGGGGAAGGAPAGTSISASRAKSPRPSSNAASGTAAPPRGHSPRGMTRTQSPRGVRGTRAGPGAGTTSGTGGRVVKFAAPAPTSMIHPPRVVDEAQQPLPAPHPVPQQTPQFVRKEGVSTRHHTLPQPGILRAMKFVPTVRSSVGGV
ncbi:unnamed protein product [Amoebophrya sp. A120]|nr:unnamed protein product [Amoebophrya sp. A120]|eukprot:GSA120T00023261001.1